ncbi:3D-(3,5/4)-trihydroxycyclohexane-1,2-dione acylhydrolase [Spiroplasma chinense]|uniref:3D-(3,5/4)-trihydroxycyclohexane-1,2-dione acylhydrolase n=1 Tax=Spiroplasma chinense TaxID=216932 RepID=A0A5B9Y443_9MOLU|nr:3D-(3,5/4)-trihydroxycyclohexane-1,2-dione acylhydrolase (decyclizing) [Spiroplasma chinense]QEH61844.1 3D-(3,5/4)-trihydroxycyclohexane-1,2-dione acylhydrolase [Spiroplasma chinense]
MNKIKLSVGEAIVKFIDNQFLEIDGVKSKIVDGVFTIYGHGNVVGLGEALTNFKHNLKVMQGKNEQGMAHIAIGYAKQNLRRKVLAVTSSVGPGSANLVTAAGTATANRIPLLLFPGDTFANRQPDPVLQQIEFDNNNDNSTNDALRAVSKFWDRIYRPEQIMSSLINAFRVLTDPENTGTVTICLPQDVQGEVYDYPQDFFKERIHYLERPRPSYRALEDATELIKSAKKPLMIIGGGALYSEASEELKKFSSTFKIPFGLTQAGKGTIEHTHEFNLGGIGVTGTMCANIAAKQADLIIGIGTRYTDFTTGSKSLFNDNAKFININLNKKDVMKLDALSLKGDAKTTINYLTDQLEQFDYVSEWKDEISTLKSEWEKEVEVISSGKDILIKGLDSEKVVEEFKNVFDNYFHQTQLFKAIESEIKKMDDDAIVVGAAGSLPGDLQRLWNVNSVNTYSVEYGYSCMGYEIAAAIGVKMAEPNKEVYAFVGDGSFLMLHSEILTALQENVKINIILLDNSGYGCIDNLQTSKGINSNSTHFRKRKENNILDGELLNVNYSMIAQGYGCFSKPVNNFEELESAFREAREQEKVTLLEFKVLPKTMTEGYETWWRVGLTDNGKTNLIKSKKEEDKKVIERIKEY